MPFFDSFLGFWTILNRCEKKTKRRKRDTNEIKLKAINYQSRALEMSSRAIQVCPQCFKNYFYWFIVNNYLVFGLDRKN